MIFDGDVVILIDVVIGWVKYGVFFLMKIYFVLIDVMLFDVFDLFFDIVFMNFFSLILNNIMVECI